MNSYEQKQEARRERLEARADRLRAEGNAAYNRAHKMAEAIPFGQPILVGHHSEKRDRNYRGKIHNTFGKAFSTLKEADEVAARAASVGSGGISSDDPEAVQKLEEKLAEEQNIHAARVADNKAARKEGKAGPWASWELSNRNANIRRIKERIEHLKRNAQRETKETLHNSGVRMVENAEENRLQLFFQGKPSEQIRKELKSCGFRWSPMAGAWQRHLSHGAKWAAECVLKKVIEQQCSR